MGIPAATPNRARRSSRNGPVPAPEHFGPVVGRDRIEKQLVTLETQLVEHPGRIGEAIEIGGKVRRQVLTVLESPQIRPRHSHERQGSGGKALRHQRQTSLGAFTAAAAAAAADPPRRRAERPTTQSRRVSKLLLRAPVLDPVLSELRLRPETTCGAVATMG
jgi:hypothetical protein